MDPFRILETEDPETLQRLRTLLANPALDRSGLREEVDWLVHRHLALVRRLGKITRISDGYQVQIQEANLNLKEASNTDPLTGLPNRRAMLARLKAEMGRSLRGRRPLALLMADVDRFKRFNDTYGHEVGDRVLRHLGEILHHSLRSYDTLARWGGEEFLVLLPETELDAALGVAEKLRERVRRQPLVVEERSLGATVSIGVAVHHRGEKLTALLRRVDHAMYEAKGRGRDRVIVAPPPPAIPRPVAAGALEGAFD